MEGMTDVDSASGLVGAHQPAPHRNRVLGRASWTVLRDLRRPGGEAGRIDRVFVGPGGIVVVESARWLGDAAVERGGLRHNGDLRDDAAEHVGQTAAAVASLMPPALRTSVRAVLSLAYQDLAPTALGPADVVGESGLEAWLLALPERLDAVASDEAACLLLRTLVGHAPDVSTSAELDAPRRRRASEPVPADHDDNAHLRMTFIVPPSSTSAELPVTVVTPARPRSAAPPAPARRPRRASALWPFAWFGAAVVAFLNIESLAALLG